MPDKHIMLMPVEAAVQACRAYNNQIEFKDQFDLLINTLAEWIRNHRSAIDSAYLTVRDAGLLFLLVHRDTAYDQKLEEELTDLDLHIANDEDYSLIRLDVLALPNVSEDASRSFLAAKTTLRFLSTTLLKKVPDE